MTDRFLEELRTRKPLFTSTIDHRNFKLCRRKMEALAKLLPPETAIIVVGPSHCGKSLLLAYFVSYLMRDMFSKPEPASTPIIGFTALTSREGRTAPKFALHELLEAVGHPFYQPAPLNGEKALYRPSTRLDETHSLRALKNALHIAKVRVVIGDDAHYLVRSKDDAFKASLLESFKSLITPRTTLVLSGGYELAQVALSLRAHLATRVIIVHLPRYTDSENDAAEWLSILGNFSTSPKIQLAQPDLLVSMSGFLRRDCHGVIGSAEKRLLKVQTDAMALGTAITWDLLNESRPTTAEWDAIGADIEMGEALLGTRVGAWELPPPESPPQDHPNKASHPPAGKKKKRRPFERVPQRTQPWIDA